jgi:hypothetical protein
MNCPLKEEEKQPSKKKPNISSNSILFIFAREPFKKKEVLQNVFLENLGLLIVKNHIPFQFVESNWLKKFNMHLCPKIVFVCIKQFFNELLLGLVEKKLNNYMSYHL